MHARIKGLQLGADDFVSKPFNEVELIARIQAVVRRSHGASESVLTIGNLSIDLARHAVMAGGHPVKLTGKEYEVIELLSLRKGTSISKDTFLNHLYGCMDEPDPKIIDVFVCKIRKKLARFLPGESYIETD